MFIFVGNKSVFLDKDEPILFVNEDDDWDGNGFPPSSGVFLTQWGLSSISWFWVDRIEQ